LRAAIAAFHARTADEPVLPEAITAPRWMVELLAPLPRPRSLRDFYAYEAHVAAGYAKRGRPVPPVWYELPVYFHQHPGSVIGPDAPLAAPTNGLQLDFEAEIAVVIGVAGRDIQPARAWSHVAGLTIMNDWSLRDLQAREMTVGLGPAKAKDFATSLGPAIVTLDELAASVIDDRHALDVSIVVDGDEIATSNTGGAHWSVPQMLAHASRGVTLEPGDVIGLGTIPRGCLLELGEEVQPWLRAGNVVDLHIAGLGRLRNAITG
jgi:fumarylacetoacetate (FAA) hydrolase